MKRLFPNKIRTSTTQRSIQIFIAIAVAVPNLFIASCSSWGRENIRVDFLFQDLDIVSPRQGGKTMNVFVSWRYPKHLDRCPFNPNNDLCIQYQKNIRTHILAVLAGSSLPLDSEWEQVVLELCRYIYSHFEVSALSVQLQVNGDSRSAEERGDKPFEPGAHGATCTIGAADFVPLRHFNRLPDLK